MSSPKLDAVYRYALQADNITGNVAEVGVFRGGTSKLLALCLPTRTVFSFDTFDGLPEGNATHGKGAFSSKLREVKAYLSDCKNIRIIDGVFPETADIIRDEVFSLIHLDVDLYKYTVYGLEFFYQRMAPGGIMVLDDYRWKNCPGVTRAIDEFFLDKKEKPTVTVQGQQAVVIKE